MPLRQRIVRIGNSRGVRLPATMLDEARLSEGDEVEISAEIGQIVLRPVRQPRDGWAEKFAEMAQRGDDQLLDADSLTPTDWDRTEWEW